MAFFSFLTKKEKKKEACCCDCTEQKTEQTSCCCSSEKEDSCCCENSEHETKTDSCCCGEEVEGICCVRVLGAGCKSCHELYENAKKAVKNLGLSIDVDYITDMEKVIEFGAMSMPALVINDKVVSMGKVLKAEAVEKLINDFEA